MDFNIILRTISEALETFLIGKLIVPVKIVGNLKVTKDEKFKAYKDITLTLYAIVNKKKTILSDIVFKERIVTEAEETKAIRRALFTLLSDINIYIDNKRYTELEQ